MGYLLAVKAFFGNPIVKTALIIMLVLGIIYGYGYTQRLDERGKFEKKEAAQAQLDADAKAQADKAAESYRITMEAAVDDLTQQAKARQVVHTQVQTVIKEVVKYVPKSVDKRSVDANVFTSGWVYLHDLPLNSTAPGLSPGLRGNVEAPTGLAASTVARIDASNLNECVARGEVISDWQKWYALAKANWEKYKSWLPGAPGTKAVASAAPASEPVADPDEGSRKARLRKNLGFGLPNPFVKD